MSKRRWIKFWISSNRGTDEREIFNYPASVTKDQIISDLLGWCERFGCCNSSESIVRYGWTDIKPINKRIALKEYRIAVKKRFAAEKRYKEALSRVCVHRRNKDF